MRWQATLSHGSKLHVGDPTTSGLGPEGPPVSAAPKPSLAGTAILVVEDDPSSARLLQVLLSGEGADVQVARSAEEALVALSGFPARLVVLDLVLPRMSGLLLVRQLKADPSTHSLIVIAVSSMNGQQTENLAIDAGCAAYLPKPIDVHTIAHTLASHLTGPS